MLTLHDYLPSQNGYKVRLLLSHLRLPYRMVPVSIFEGEGRKPEFMARNPTGAVPVLELESGATLPESNAILCYLADGTPYLPSDPWQRAQVLRWMFFEEDYIQNGLASLRYWTLTGKLARRSPELIEQKRALSLKTLGILEGWLGGHPFLAADRYTIADMSVYAYTAFGEEAGLPMSDFASVLEWIRRVRSQPGFLHESYGYSIDPHSQGDLP
ncbi:MAG TPA: glutathione S-transferase family protein [Steroidobacteraceae bacterium]|nr:glutathione S-transferase family protein [Steroidobacteraceae bacterium]